MRFEWDEETGERRYIGQVTLPRIQYYEVGGEIEILGEMYLIITTEKVVEEGKASYTIVEYVMPKEDLGYEA